MLCYALLTHLLQRCTPRSPQGDAQNRSAETDGLRFDMLNMSRHLECARTKAFEPMQAAGMQRWFVAVHLRAQVGLVPGEPLSPVSERTDKPQDELPVSDAVWAVHSELPGRHSYNTYRGGCSPS